MGETEGTFLEYYTNRYYSKFDKNKLIEDYNKKNDKELENIESEFVSIFYYILKNRPCYYWNKEVKKCTFNKLSKIIEQNTIILNNEILEYFFIAYDTYQQITEVIQDLYQLSLEEKLKNRIYRIPTYISIVEGCLSNIYRFITNILDQTTEKDFKSQNKLNGLCEVLNTNQLSTLTKDINIDIRNAINHGGVINSNNGQEITFHYIEKGKQKNIKISIFEFDKLINKTFDVCSGAILGIVCFLNCNKSLIYGNNITENKYIAFRLLSLRLSIPTLVCEGINDESIGKKQLNIFMRIDNSDRIFLIQTAVEIILQVYNEFPQYEQYHVNVENDRLPICFMRLKKEDILGFINNHEMMNIYLEKAIKREDFQIPEPEEERANVVKEIKYYKYPTYENDNYKILSVEDISIEERKRIKANLFVGDIEQKEELLDIMRESIDWLKKLNNTFTNSKSVIKQGEMEADSVYLYVHHNDIREGLNAYINNKNFICFVDYNLNGETTLKKEGYWNNFFHEKIDNLDIAWREQKYIDKKEKIGRNDKCPCGSDKKYKNCCGK